MINLVVVRDTHDLVSDALNSLLAEYIRQKLGVERINVRPVARCYTPCDFCYWGFRFEHVVVLGTPHAEIIEPASLWLVRLHPVKATPFKEVAETWVSHGPDRLARWAGSASPYSARCGWWELIEIKGIERIK